MALVPPGGSSGFTVRFNNFFSGMRRNMADTFGGVRGDIQRLLCSPLTHIARNSTEMLQDAGSMALHAGIAVTSVKTLPTNAAATAVGVQAAVQQKKILEEQKKIQEREHRLKCIREVADEATSFGNSRKITTGTMTFAEKNKLFERWRVTLETISIANLPKDFAEQRCMITGQMPIYPIFIPVDIDECPMKNRFSKYQNMPKRGYCFDFYSFLVYCSENQKFPWEINAPQKRSPDSYGQILANCVVDLRLVLNIVSALATLKDQH